MSKLKNVERVEQTAHQKTWFQRFRTSAKYAPVAVGGLLVSNAHAADIPTLDTADLLGYIAVVVAAVSTVGAAFLMVYLAAKGIKAIRAAF